MSKFIKTIMLHACYVDYHCTIRVKSDSSGLLDFPVVLVDCVRCASDLSGDNLVQALIMLRLFVAN